MDRVHIHNNIWTVVMCSRYVLCPLSKVVLTVIKNLQQEAQLLLGDGTTQKPAEDC